MPSLSDFVPEIAAYQQAQQQGQQRQLGQLQQVGALQGILAKMQAAQKEQALRGELSALGPKPSQEALAQLAAKYSPAADILKSQTASADRKAALEAATATRDAAREQALAMHTERLQQQATLAQQRSEDLRLSAAERNQARMDAIRLAASLRPERQEQPLVPVIGPDGKPVLVPRRDAVGRTPAGAGSKAEATEAGKADVDKDVMTLKSALDQLNEGGGITSTTKGVLPNVGRWASNTGPGQILGSMGGTYNQKARDVIAQARPLLMRSIMQSTGMSSRSIDSNAELKLWLSTATDPTKGYEANIEALNNIASKYGSGGFIEGQTSVGKINQSRRADDVPAGIDPKVWGAMTPAEKKLFK